MKTAVLSGDAIDNEMSEDASGEKKMKIGKGANAADKPDDAVGEKGQSKSKPANGTSASGNKTAGAARRLQGSNATKVTGNGTQGNGTNWKNLKAEDEKVQVIVNKKMFEKGGPLFGIKHPIVIFNQHEKEQLKDYPVGKKSSYNANGTRINKTKAELEAENKKK